MNDDVMVVDDGQETPKAQPKIRVYGAGSPVLLLSGGPGFSADYMEPLARELELQYQAVLPDLRGTGTNTVEETPENLSLDAYVEDVENIRKQYGWDKFSFVAHSSGAQIALAYALKYPHFVKSIALLDPAGTDTGYLEEFNRVADSRLNRLDKEILADWKAGNGDFTEGLTTLLYRVVFDRRTANKIVEMVPQKSFFNQKTADTYTQGLVDSGFNITDRLGELSSIPVYVAHGLLDPLPYEVGKSIAEKTGGKFVLQDNCGHFPWIEVPREFYPQFLGFLFQNAW